MIDDELLRGIRKFIACKKDFTELNKRDALEAINCIAKKFIIDRSKKWWWTDLTQDSVKIEYGESDGLLFIEELVNKDTEVLFFITDDEPEPWPVFQGKLSTVIEIIAEQRFFEYFLTDKDYSWIIFDTHHNSFIIGGALLNIAVRKKIGEIRKSEGSK